MDIIARLRYTIARVIETISHNWYLLLINIVISVASKFYVHEDAITP